MITIECPWCAEAATIEMSRPDELACDGCGVTVDIAPDPIREGVARAA